MLSKFCSVSNIAGSDDFVGVCIANGIPKVVFPMGFSLSNNDEQIRRDILNLLTVLRDFTNRREGASVKGIATGESAFPLFSYQYIILDYISNGYYREKEVYYINGVKGKINWKKTIQKVQPQLNNGNVVYLENIVKTSQIKEEKLITQIHKYCVYVSFYKFGWLYVLSDKLPAKPEIKFNYNLFMTTLQTAFSSTFNVAKKQLFKSMMNIIAQEKDTQSARLDFSFGVNRFEYVWEGMIDYVFGEEQKERFFPHARWHILNNCNDSISSALAPDTVLIRDGKAYIIDAKYYKYGITRMNSDLPHSDSIQKQITYGEYLRSPNSAALIGRQGDYSSVYNAFVMPFDGSRSGSSYELIGIATADWKSSQLSHEKVVGLLLDTRHLIEVYSRYNLQEINQIVSVIEAGANNFNI